ncbi:MAG: nucleotidyltransferase [Deltaproteobacteria bacterium RBG_13_61_14]|nr:MAG: nucleotidyltransferase [Deltaproteobacteria bacterium RBG_13_61_14]
MNYHGIEIQKDKIAEFCRKNHIQKLALFGSILRGDFQSESDVDVLVEFEPGHTPGLAFFRMQDELAEILGKKVDLNTPQCLSKYYRDEVLAEAEVQFDQT